MDVLLQCGTLVVGGRAERDWCVLVRDGRILEVAARINPPPGAIVVDASREIVLPGLIDIHVHGAVGADAMDAAPDAFHAMARHFARHGVTGFLATTMTARAAEISAALRETRAAMDHPPSGARVLGAHIEGPYLNPRWCGAQDPALIHAADPEEYGPWLDSGAVRVITVAPEVAGNARVVADALENGAAVALGHTDVTYDQALAWFDRGANQATHTFNAMRGLHHREPGLVGAVMSRPDVFAQLICDNVHVHPAVVALMYQAKGSARLAVISDAQRATGMPDGQYLLGGQIATVRDGRATLANGTLAGSTLTMDAALRNIMAATGCGLAEAARMCAHTPAAAIGLGASKGLAQAGYDADLALFDAQLRPTRTMIGGQFSPV